MTKEEALQAIKLLSALESWAYSVSNSKSSPVPDYLHDHLQESMAVLERILLEKPQESYIYGTELLDAMIGTKKP